MESVPWKGTNLTVVPVVPAAAPKVVGAGPKADAEAPKRPLVCAGCAAGWAKSVPLCAGWACGWPNRPVDVVEPKPNAGFCAPNAVLVDAPKRPPVAAGAAAGCAAAPNMPVDCVGAPKMLPPEVAAPNPTASKLP